MELCNDSLVLQNETMKPYEPFIIGASMILFISITIVGNAMTVAAYVIDKRLRNVYNTFIFNLAVTDLLIGLISMPFHGWYTVNKFEWKLGRPFCKVWFAFDFTLCLESVLTILLLSYDRLLLIRHGHRYETKVTMKSAIVKIVISWIVAFLVWAPCIIFWDIVKGCTIVEENVCEVEFINDLTFNLTTSIIEFFLPLKGLLIINGILYCKLRKFLRDNKVSREETDGLTSDTLETLTEGEDAVADNCQKDAAIVAEEQTSTEINSEDKETEALKQPSNKANGKTSKDNTSSADKAETIADKTNTLAKYKNGETNDPALKDNKKKQVLSEEIIERMEPSVMPEPQNIANKNYKIETSVSAGSDVEGESSEILKSVLDVMERHGSYSFSSSTENILDSIKNDETASIASEPSSMESSKSFSEVALTLKKKFTNVKYIVSANEQNVENLGLETVNQQKQQMAEDEIKPVKTYREVDIDQAIKERKVAGPVTRKGSTVSTVTTRIKRNTKAARFLAILVAVFFVCWAPYTVATIIDAFCIGNTHCVNRLVYEVLTWLLWLKSAINPFLYAYNSSRYKRNFKRFLSCCRKRNHRITREF